MLDARSRKIVGWAVDGAMPASLVSRAFERAIRQRKPEAGLLHHSDRGSQYASDAFRELPRRHGALASMSRKANCHDNARMESFKGHAQKRADRRAHLQLPRGGQASAIFDYIELFYNRRRLHSAPGFQSPVDFENNLS